MASASALSLSMAMASMSAANCAPLGPPLAESISLHAHRRQDAHAKSLPRMQQGSSSASRGSGRDQRQQQHEVAGAGSGRQRQKRQRQKRKGSSNGMALARPVALTLKPLSASALVASLRRMERRELCMRVWRGARGSSAAAAPAVNPRTAALMAEAGGAAGSAAAAAPARIQPSTAGSAATAAPTRIQPSTQPPAVGRKRRWSSREVGSLASSGPIPTPPSSAPRLMARAGGAAGSAAAAALARTPGIHTAVEGGSDPPLMAHPGGAAGSAAAAALACAPGIEPWIPRQWREAPPPQPWIPPQWREAPLPHSLPPGGAAGSAAASAPGVQPPSIQPTALEGGSAPPLGGAAGSAAAAAPGDYARRSADLEAAAMRRAASAPICECTSCCWAVCEPPRKCLRCSARLCRRCAQRWPDLHFGAEAWFCCRHLQLELDAQISVEDRPAETSCSSGSSRSM